MKIEHREICEMQLKQCLGDKFIALNIYVRKEESSKNYLKKLEKEEQIKPKASKQKGSNNN